MGNWQGSGVEIRLTLFLLKEKPQLNHVPGPVVQLTEFLFSESNDMSLFLTCDTIRASICPVTIKIY